MADEARPIGQVVFKDLTIPDMVAIVIAFKVSPGEHHWAQIHRDLQQKWKANFPYFWRRDLKKYGDHKNCWAFLGFKRLKTKGVRR